MYSMIIGTYEAWDEDMVIFMDLGFGQMLDIPVDL